jgi:hypothetical protein
MGLTNEVKKDLLLKILLVFGGAGAGVGFWAGKTWVFEPTLSPPAITEVKTKSLVWENERVPLARVIVKTDGVGRIGLVYTYTDKEGESHKAFLPAQARADQYVFDLRRDLRVGWSVLDLPSWIKRLEVWSFRGDWNGTDWGAPHKVEAIR